MKRQRPLSPHNISRKNDTIPELYIGLEDHDFAILYYIDNVINPTVIENGQVVKVPVIYGSPERWKSVRIDGYYRSEDNQIMRPLIMFKRTGFEKRRNITRNLDPDAPKMFIDFIQPYNRKNKYDQFSAIRNSTQKRAIQSIIVPDYITLSYDAIVWVDYIEDMNKIIEAIQYGESTYWGDAARNFKFYTTISNYSDVIELSNGADRLLKTSFTITMQGYLIPNSLQKRLSQESEISITNNQIITEINSEQYISTVKAEPALTISGVSINGNTNSGNGYIGSYTNLNAIQQMLGGINVGETFNGVTFNSMFDKLLYPYLSPVFTEFSLEEIGSGSAFSLGFSSGFSHGFSSGFSPGFSPGFGQ
jgi:hypothetical protein